MVTLRETNFGFSKGSNILTCITPRGSPCALRRKGTKLMPVVIEFIKKYKMFYSGWFSPIVLQFWSMVIIYYLCWVGAKIAIRYGFNASPADTEWWGGTSMLATVSLSSVVGLVRLLMVVFCLEMPMAQRGVVALVASVVYVPILIFLLAIFLWFFMATSMFVAGMIFGVK